MAYTCGTCGKTHDSLPDLSVDKPDAWWTIPEEERDRRIRLNSDLCVIDEQEFYIRGVIQIPIVKTRDMFGFGVWVSQKDVNFRTYTENSDSDRIGPFFGWLATELSCYAEKTLLLKTMAHFRGKGLRPAIELEPTRHPLALDQRNGITLERAWELVHHYMPDA